MSSGRSPSSSGAARPGVGAMCARRFASSPACSRRCARRLADAGFPRRSSAPACTPSSRVCCAPILRPATGLSSWRSRSARAGGPGTVRQWLRRTGDVDRLASELPRRVLRHARRGPAPRRRLARAQRRHARVGPDVDDPTAAPRQDDALREDPRRGQRRVADRGGLLARPNCSAAARSRRLHTTEFVRRAPRPYVKIVQGRGLEFDRRPARSAARRGRGGRVDGHDRSSTASAAASRPPPAPVPRASATQRLISSAIGARSSRAVRSAGVSRRESKYSSSASRTSAFASVRDGAAVIAAGSSSILACTHPFSTARRRSTAGSTRDWFRHRRSLR
jgi:hypothetical protein